MKILEFRLKFVSSLYLLIVCSTVCSGPDHTKHQSSTSLAFVRGITGEFPSQRANNADFSHLMTSTCAATDVTLLLRCFNFEQHSLRRYATILWHCIIHNLISVTASCSICSAWLSNIPVALSKWHMWAEPKAITQFVYHPVCLRDS